MKHPAPSAAKRRGEAVREVKWFVPIVLFSVWPFVHFANRNRDESFDAIRLIGDATVYAVAVSCLVLVVGLVFHRRRFGQIAGVAGVGTVVLFLYGVLDTMWLDFGASAPRYPLITWFILGVLALLLTWRLSRHAATVRVLTVAAAVMTGLPTVQLIFHHGWSASEPVPVLEGTARSEDPTYTSSSSTCTDGTISCRGLSASTTRCSCAISRRKDSSSPMKAWPTTA